MGNPRRDAVSRYRPAPSLPPMGGFPPPTFRAVCFSPPITEPSLEHGVWGTRANHIGAHRELATVLFST